MRAQLVGTVPFGLEQQAVVVQVAEVESLVGILQREDLGSIPCRVGRSREDKCLVAVQGSIVEAQQEVGLLTGQHEIMVGSTKL